LSDCRNGIVAESVQCCAPITQLFKQLNRFADPMILDQIPEYLADHHCEVKPGSAILTR
jgi:hypothetical protein